MEVKEEDKAKGENEVRNNRKIKGTKEKEVKGNEEKDGLRKG